MELDNEIRQELIDSFNDLSEEVEDGLTKLENTPSDKEVLAAVFRAIHSMKGNAGMVQLDRIVNFAHAIENVAESLRQQKYPTTPRICEVILLGIERLKEIHFRDVLGHQVADLHEAEAIDLFNRLAEANAADTDDAANNILELLTDSDLPNKGSAPEPPNDFNKDLYFFHEVALQIDNQTQYWEGRSIQLFDWALKVNRIGGNVIPYEQFAAAIYLHDIGMSFLPSSIIETPDKLSNEQNQLLRNHTIWGYDYLIRIPGWEEAARIVLEHHERVDGTGYPNGKIGNEIHAGAKILAILDAFFSMLRGRADRSKRASVLKAINEINACVDTQFDGMWVQCFNHMVREEVKSGLL